MHSFFNNFYSWRLFAFLGFAAATLLFHTCSSFKTFKLLKTGAEEDERSSDLVACSVYLQETDNATFAQSRKDDDSFPKIAWLMSFPNSGTSYTLDLVHSITKTLTATNYGGGDFKRESYPVFEDQPEGPFWSTTIEEQPRYREPDTYVLVKTHCGGYGFDCPLVPETACNFARSCLSGKRTVRSVNDTLSQESVTYSPRRVKKAIHIIRDPFDNVVSRYHLYVKANGHTIEHPDTDGATTFRNFCMAMNEKYELDNDTSRNIDDYILNISAIIPCRADFFRYAEWHNFAFETIHHLELDTMMLYYDQYTTNFHETAARLVEFLESNITSEPAEFVEGKVYRHLYYTAEEQNAALEVLKYMASRETWSYLQRFFV